MRVLRREGGPTQTLRRGVNFLANRPRFVTAGVPCVTADSEATFGGDWNYRWCAQSQACLALRRRSANRCNAHPCPIRAQELTRTFLVSLVSG